MNTVSLKKIDTTNYTDCFHLQLEPWQECYVSHPIRSLAQAYIYYNQCTPFGIYAGERMVGYVMVIYDDEEQTYNVWHMMIDKAFQHRGYGTNALKQVLAYIETRPFGPSETILLTCKPDNTTAYSLYMGMGFRKTGRADGDEVEMEKAIRISVT